MKAAMENTKNPVRKKSRLPLILLAAAVFVIGIVLVFHYLNTPAEIAVVTAPNKTIYDFGDTLDPQGLSVEVTYNSGRTEVITQGFTCAPMELTSAGVVDITVTYEEKTAVFSVEAIPVLTGIRVTAAPETTRYLHGSQLDLQGLQLEGDYNDGSVQPITSNFTCTPMELTQLGKQEITVSYEDKTTSFPVEVVEVTNLTVRTMSARTVYMVGEAPDPAGITLNVTYSNGDEEVLREGYTCSEAVFTEPGTQEVTVSFAGADAAYAVEVFPAVTFAEFTTELTCASYGDGSGYNAYGAPVNWTLLFEFDLPAEIRENFPPTMTCSWDHVTNGEGMWEQECNYETAKSGTTYAESGVYAAENSPTGNERYTYILYLPDDPTIDGEQSVTLNVGCSQLTVFFTLTYAGDYETGTGWQISDIAY